jgi:hypothetical protein
MSAPPDLDTPMSVWAEHAASPYQNHHWYRAAGRLHDTIVLRAGHGAGAAVLPVWRVEENDHYYHVPRNMLCGHREDAYLATGSLDGADLRSLPWGSALVTTSPYGYLGGPSRGPQTTMDTLHRLAGALLDTAAEQRVGLVLSHFLFEERDAAWIDALVAHGGLPLVLGADCVIDVQWSSLDEYLDALGPGRRSVRRLHSRLRRSELVWTYRRAPGPDPGQEAAAALFADHVTQFDPHRPPPPSLLAAVADGSTVDRVLMSVALPGHNARSVLAVLVHGGALYPKFFGTVAPRTDYFPLAFARLIEYAIGNGFTRIEFGGGTHEAKLLRGARVRYAIGVLFVTDPTLRRRALTAGRQISAAKLDHFGALAARWQLDHGRPAPPAAVAGSDISTVDTSDV